jgi:hypothetical protein
MAVEILDIRLICDWFLPLRQRVKDAQYLFSDQTPSLIPLTAFSLCMWE